eukprot:CAMPEP_0184354988 /NCGR_PEP_ID=MMETSP1089-20130417/92492_2 /TAXON_ID=38269 ORGANISM="Gloeochaete wittrockiana, Strain SAG46.84" /NCGR_SAMPLE_ID=MMETSP1089 /ASSEMBLY_ACC=CAM_ASM_000445 /LENGTH=35 /DNA_ID= /DNA_START= /DNA_END= /DNA_ORIENTATION=
MQAMTVPAACSDVDMDMDMEAASAYCTNRAQSSRC